MKILSTKKQGLIHSQIFHVMYMYMFILLFQLKAFRNQLDDHLLVYPNKGMTLFIGAHII
jgi:hypothetical protein